MGQTPLPFVLDDGKTYDKKGTKEVWAQSGQSGLEKRKAAVQLTVFAHGDDRVRPNVIFRGKGLRINAKEKQSYGQPVKAMFQEKTWCDQGIMKEWISTEWANPFKNLLGRNSDGKILIADAYRAQQTDTVKELVKKHKPFIVHVPPKCTSRIQVVNVLINIPFKDEVRSLFDHHLDKNLDQFVDGKINASQRRVLIKKLVGEEWSKFGKMKDFILHSFKRCGLSVALDGSESDEVNIEGCQNIKCHQPLCKIMNMYFMMKMNLKKKMKIRVTLKMRKGLKF